MRSLVLKGIDNRAANIIKQSMLSIGGEAAVNWQVSNFKRGTSGLLLMGTDKHLDLLIKKLSRQPYGLRAVAEDIRKKISLYEKETFLIKSRNKTLKTGATPLIMGILNVTPDSFSDGGIFNGFDAALSRGIEMARQGAEILDVGGESTRPGAKPVSEREEIKRILPVIKGLKRKTKAFISVDTYKPLVAKAALDSGADIINDITGLRYKNNSMARLAGRYKVPVIIMHMQGNPGNMQKNPVYNDVVGEISDFFSERIKTAGQNGIKGDSIIIDPGIGFGKTLKHNLEILKRLSEFRAFGKPLLIGASRKSFIGKIVKETDPRNRLIGSVSAFIWSALNDAKILRVHDVKETVQALSVIKNIKY
jgi:dihydropteroate synthase